MLLFIIFNSPESGAISRDKFNPTVQGVYQGFVFENMKAPLFPVPVRPEVANNWRINCFIFFIV